jgi:hypothetical protein
MIAVVMASSTDEQVIVSEYALPSRGRQSSSDARKPEAGGREHEAGSPKPEA